MLRNLYNFDCSKRTNFWYIIKDNYCESDYSKNVRKYIAKANLKFEIRRISKKRMIKQGFDIYEKAHLHYKVNDGFQLKKSDFVAEINEMNDKYEFWGCIDRDTDIMQAYSICHVHDKMCWFKYSRVNPEFLPKYYPMYGLYDARNRYYLKEQKLKYVLTSARSITEHSELQSFLIEKFGFPNVVIEAGAMGLPQIVTDINGATEIIIEGKNGTIVPPKNADALQAAMLRMATDPS